MLTTRWSPLPVNLWNSLNRGVADLWNDLTAPAHTPTLGSAYPPVNLSEDDENVYLEAELPGQRLEDLEIFVTGGIQFTLQGERKPQEERGTWHRRERGFGRFSRVLELPFAVDADKV
jgi:HSP20 family protein